jgi:hypothetical protein
MQVDQGGGEQEFALTGGSMSTVVRRGQTVHRGAGPWTPTIHRLLEHLHSHGITWLPRPRGLDKQGREVLTYLPGTVPSYPMPPWVWSEHGWSTRAIAWRNSTRPARISTPPEPFGRFPCTSQPR